MVAERTSEEVKNFENPDVREKRDLGFLMSPKLTERSERKFVGRINPAVFLRGN